MNYVYAVEVCDCGEYGCCQLAGIFATASAAYEWARNHGYQNENPGGIWDWNLDYFTVTRREVKE